MKSIVIAGSAKNQAFVNKWVNYFTDKNYLVLDYPRFIPTDEFMKLYPNVHIEFFENIQKTNILFVMNEDRDNIDGYIGYETYGELLFGLSQKLIYNKSIELVLMKMPSKEVGCYEEINLWLKLGWIKIYNEEGIL